MTPTVIQINLSNGGMPKQPVLHARVTKHGLEGDHQRNKKYHGGPNRAVCLFSHELYEWLREKSIDLQYGSVGENFTTQGLDLNTLKKGDRLKVGACIIELSDVRIPCSNLKKFDPDLPELIVGHSGWVAKVIEEATVKPHDPIELLSNGQ
jgi:MOSC domain-containing protein YiiM